MSSGCSTRHLELLGDRVEQELGPQGLAGALLHLGAVLVVLEAVLTLEVLVHLGLDDAVGHGHVDRLEQVLEHLVAGLDALLVLLGLLRLLRDVGAQLLQGVELGGELGEVVVELGQLAHLDRLHGDGALGVVALVVAAGQRGGEGRGVARGQAEQRVVHALEHVLAADLVGDVGDRVDLLVADGGGQVDRDEVTVLDGPLDAHEGAEALAQRGESLLDVLVGRLDLVDLDGDALEVGQLDLGAHVGLDGELEVLAVLERHGGDVDLGLADGADVLGLGGLGEEDRECLVDGLLHHGATADALVDDPARDLALAEARDLHLGADRLVRLVEHRLQLRERDLHDELDPGRADGLDGTLHFRHSTTMGESGQLLGSHAVRAGPAGRRLPAARERAASGIGTKVPC